MIDTLLATGPVRCAGPDAELWRADVAVRPRADASAPLDVDVTVTDSTGAPVAGVPVDGVLLYDDFFPAGRATATTDAAGHATIELASDAANMGAAAGKRWLHVTASKSFPLVERVVAVP